MPMIPATYKNETKNERNTLDIQIPILGKCRLKRKSMSNRQQLASTCEREDLRELDCESVKDRYTVMVDERSSDGNGFMSKVTI
ncbi:hypothetical protein HYFRA_00010875 [Hymenoscyphus fraxineus]|uniref:Uncharacterized protein n=1 Tax=Hymenoscyphus fraxineus TaxID=746836 RepID=A0A9N9PI38_9HELO|nr:hypothetical protein HYFRA_00010875 [Hymenoscyphus fraxineus]